MVLAIFVTLLINVWKIDNADGEDNYNEDIISTRNTLSHFNPEKLLISKLKHIKKILIYFS